MQINLGIRSFRAASFCAFLGLASLVLAGAQEKSPPDAAWIGANDPKLQYNGRVGFEDPKVATFYYAASGFRGRFTGRSLALRFEEDTFGPANSFGVRIDDGVEIPVRLIAGKDLSFLVAAGLPDHIHTLEVYRRQDTVGGVTKFKGLWLDKGAELEEPAPRPQRKMEFFGDSVMAGAASVAFGYEGKLDQTIAYENADDFVNNGYWGFAAITARMLKAEANIQAVGGLPLLDHTGWFGGPLENAIGLESTWDKLDPIVGQLSQWDFSRYTPNVVVIAVGQNDAHGGNILDPVKRIAWKATYKKVLDGLRSHYPKASFVLSTTILVHDVEWDKAVQEVASEYDLDRKTECVHYIAFKQAGKGTPGHPRVAEQEEMGRELADYIDHVPGIWDR